MFWFSAFICSCMQSDKTSNTNTLENKSEVHQLRYLALGDSYTIGESVEEKNRWPIQLYDSLSQYGYILGEPTIVAKTGWTTGELKEAILSADLLESFNLVTLLIGVNNQFRNLDTSDYRNEFKELLEMAVSFAGNDVQNVVVVSIPDYGVTPFGLARDPANIAEEIDEFNRINFQETIKAGASYVNITPISREVENNPQLIAEDGLHPSGIMYHEWVKLIFPKAKKIIDNQLSNSR